jgi:very-long-chain (3R)-3-hydroxyacyl-CoA dehydratase
VAQAPLLAGIPRLSDVHSVRQLYRKKCRAKQEDVRIRLKTCCHTSHDAAEEERESRETVAKTTATAQVKMYLIAYNLLSMAGWSAVLYKTVQHYLHGGKVSELFGETGKLTTWVQTGAILEIVHSVLRFVKSPVGTTASQVFSRLMLVWGVLSLFPYPRVTESLFYTTMTMAWSVTEVIRYGFYAANLIGVVPSWLTWLRYSLFYVLYPMGAGSEAVLMYKSLPYARKFSGALFWFEVVLLMFYPVCAYLGIVGLLMISPWNAHDVHAGATR